MQDIALADFETDEVQWRVQAALLELDLYVRTHIDALTQGFIEAMREVCVQAAALQQQGEKGDIAYVTCSMLRTEILDGGNRYVAEAFDSRWFFDRKLCEVEYDASWAFGYLQRCRQEWLQAAESYHGTVKAPDIERIMLREARNFHAYLVTVTRYAMPEVIRLPEYQQLTRSQTVEFRLGEYMDLSEVVYKDDFRETDSEAVRRTLAAEEESAYRYEVFNHAHLQDLELEKVDLRYSRLNQCDLSRSVWNGAVLMGTRWESCMLAHTDLSFSLLLGADFSGCMLKGAKLQGIIAGQGTMQMSEGAVPVSFRGADVQEADFTGADLRGAIFIDANVRHTNFQGARLDQALFSFEAREQLALSEEQLQSVIWVKAQGEAGA
ncbi:pentapeptide repeat-containing protein [Paenibacillus hexagrammi]|uniref:Pentapeptide repeat-containing protein n=1 Tax=Paenibacillus hexagrammi TaxID=2908839 RepID=A0ABY3SS04_9BACL|nr:pentapeptide repeat-containing protein [Paenibacillus sp. YPD9-1]UJF36439.1 pentapeptide repeat-containing protein [Paenibacillus sp. YPD9-1]